MREVKKVKEVIKHGTETQQNIVILLSTSPAHLPILPNPTASLHLPPNYNHSAAHSPFTIGPLTGETVKLQLTAEPGRAFRGNG